jgi:hypothetical protein
MESNYEQLTPTNFTNLQKVITNIESSNNKNSGELKKTVQHIKNFMNKRITKEELKRKLLKRRTHFLDKKMRLRSNNNHNALKRATRKMTMVQTAINSIGGKRTRKHRKSNRKSRA